MAQPFVGQSGRIRLNRLTEAVANSKAPADAGASPVIGANAQEPVIDPATGAPVDPVVLQEAIANAEAGDKAAIDWLKGLGIAGGVAGAGIGAKLLYDTLKNRKPKQQMTPDGIIPTPEPGTAITKSNKPIDLYIDLPASEYKEVDGYIPPIQKRALEQKPRSLPNKVIKSIGKAF